MKRPIILEVNCATGEEVYRELNDDEYAQYLLDQEARAALQTND
jgi:hypothetical protein